MKTVNGQDPHAELMTGLDLTDQDFQIIAEEYWQGLYIPEQRPARKLILCPIGLVGAGKSTVVKPMAKELFLVRVSGDEIRKLLKERGFNWTRTIEIAFYIIRRLAEGGYGIAIDSDCAGKNIIDVIEGQANIYGYLVLYIHVNPPEDFIINKLQNFKHTWLFEDAEHAISDYYRRKPLHKDIHLPFVYTFDTSRPDIDQQIVEAVDIIRAAIA